MRYFLLFFSSFLYSVELRDRAAIFKGFFYDDIRLINVSYNPIEIYCFELSISCVYNSHLNNVNNKENNNINILKHIDFYLGANINICLFNSVGVFFLIYDSFNENIINKYNLFLRLQYQLLFGRIVVRVFTDINYSNNIFFWKDNIGGEKSIGVSIGYFVHDKISMSVLSKLYCDKFLKFLKSKKD